MANWVAQNPLSYKKLCSQSVYMHIIHQALEACIQFLTVSSTVRADVIRTNCSTQTDQLQIMSSPHCIHYEGEIKDTKRQNDWLDRRCLRRDRSSEPPRDIMGLLCCAVWCRRDSLERIFRLGSDTGRQIKYKETVTLLTQVKAIGFIEEIIVVWFG